jgi:hypothetical protein
MGLEWDGDYGNKALSEFIELDNFKKYDSTIFRLGDV